MYEDGTNRSNQPAEHYTYVEGSGFVAPGPGHGERRTLAVYANSAGFCLLLLLFLRVSLPVYIIRFFLLLYPQLRYSNAHLMGPELLVQLIQGLCTLLSFAPPFLLYAYLVRIPARAALPLRRPTLSVALPAVFVTLGVAALASLTSTALSRLLRVVRVIPIHPAVSLPGGESSPGAALLSLLASLLLLCVLPAILEEFAFRGVLLQSLRRFGDGFALVISSILFMLLHRNVSQMPAALLVGLVIGYFVLYTGSVWTGVLLHFCNNFTALLQQLLLPQLAERATRLAQMGTALCFLLLGLIFAVLLARSHRDMFRLEPSPSALTSRERVLLYFSRPAILVVLVFSAGAALRSLQILP